MNNIQETFESKIQKKILSMGVDLSSNLNLAVAVSGGADSVALLTCLHRILQKNINLYAVTVNHNIRPKSETEGDASFVQDYCKKLGLQCFRFDIPRGQVEKNSRDFDCGIEDSARRLRYQIFSEFKEQNGIDFICLAHNQNDQLETVLMRFLSGGDSNALGGIPESRGCFLRPMIEISRQEIENYLKSLDVDFRTDSTNFDTSLTRNRIRQKLMPFLDQEFSGWKSAVLNLSEKQREDGKCLEECAEGVLESIKYSTFDKSKATFDFKNFSILGPALKRRIVYKAIDFVGAKTRVPYDFVKRISGKTSPDDFRINSSGINAEMKNGLVSIEKIKKQATESTFFVIIKTSGTYVLGDWTVFVSDERKKIELEIVGTGEKKSVISVPNLCFPFILRSRQPDDRILTSDGHFKSVSRILEDWKCKPQHREQIILVQELSTLDQNLLALVGSHLSYGDWILK